MKTRILTALLITAGALALLYFRGAAVTLGGALLLVASQYELMHALRQRDIAVKQAVVYATGIMMCAAAYFFGAGCALAVLAAGFMVTMGVTMLSKQPSPQSILLSALAVLYPAVGMLCILALALGEDWQFAVLPCAIFGGAGSDVFGFLIGSKFGKKRLCPALSPKKSVEGAVAGVFGGVLFSVIVKYLLLFTMDIYISMAAAVIVGALCAAASIFGDLFASAIKRYSNIKDFSTILPGHGGVMDRLDSVYFASITAWIIVSIMKMI